MFTKDIVDLKALAWPVSMLDEAVELLARKGGLLQHPVSLPPPPAGLEQIGDELIGQWIEAVASQLKLESEPIASSYAQLEQLLYHAGPAILRLVSSDRNEPCFLALLKGNRRGIVFIGPDLSLHRVRPDVVCSALRHELEAPVVRRADQTLAQMGVSDRRRARARPAIAQKEIGTAPIGRGWLLRLSPGASLWEHIRRASLFRTLLLMVGTYTVRQALELVAWVVIGQSVLTGQLDWARFWAWALLLLTAIPFASLSDRLGESLSNDLGRLFKWQLLHGVSRLDPDDVRHQGAGQFMGRVLESQWLEALAMSGGIATLMVGIVLVVANLPLLVGAGGWLNGLLLWGWVAFAMLLAWLYHRWNGVGINAYRDMTNDLVEQMMGHRTRLAQADRSRWHEEEDQILARYVKLCEKSYPTEVMLLALIPRGWMVLGLLGLVPAFIGATGADSRITLTLGIGGILLAFQSLTTLVQGIRAVAMSISMWTQIEPLLQAATHPKEDRAVALLPQAEQRRPTHKRPLLVARGIDFRYHRRGRLVLEKCDLQIREGDRWLLEGPSGGGKSTLASLLTGLRTPQSGLILLKGFDRQTIGADMWRRRVVMAPQFHENHVFTETLAFNLLMGRGWPPLPKDLAEAETVCRELGLGDLLDRMPDGLLQIVGEGGWRLSHGECSRLYIARAILQKAALIILDESFGALDPESLQKALLCVHNRASTLLVIAHP